MDPKKKFWLFKQAKHFCSVPWNHIEIWSTGSIRTCSKGHQVGNINESSIAKILNDKSFISLKQDLLNDKLNSNCYGCNTLSSDDHYDLRNHYNPMFKSFNINYEDVTAFELHGIDLHWNNTCNFKCVYCNPYQSSLIAQEQNVLVNKIDIENINDIIAMIVKNQYSMKEIYLSGGEPLLIKHNAKLLSLIENKNLPIRINSNISVATDENPVFSEIKKFKNVLWTVSAESSGERFNYIRNGGDWNKFVVNLNNIKQLGHGIRLNSVFFIASLASIFDTIEYFITQHNIDDITINQLAGHKYLLSNNAPEELKILSKIQIDKILNSGLIKYQSNSYYNILRCKTLLDQPGDSKEYINYFDNLDSIRGTNWRQIFKELIV